MGRGFSSVFTCSTDKLPFYGHEKEFRSFAELKKSIDEYVDWYNNERIVQRLGGAPVSNRSIEPVPLLCYSPT